MLDASSTIPSATLHAAHLRTAVNMASQVTEKRNTIPILGMIRITVTEDGAVVRATDLDMEIFVQCDVISLSDTVDFTIDPRLMRDLLSWAEGEVVITKKGDLITFQIDDVEAQVREICDARTDWPAMISWQSQPIAMGETALHRALSACIGCISTEETRYYLNGIYLHAVDGMACMVATDGHRLAKYQTTDAWPFAGHIMPRKCVSLLSRMLRKGGNGTVTVMAAPDLSNSTEPSLAPKQPVNRMEFQGEGWKLITKTIDGTFPDYTRVIPKAEAISTVTLSHHALRRFGQPSERCRAVAIDAGAGRIVYSRIDGPTISMPVQATGDVKAGYNLDYLRSFTRNAGTIRLEITGAGDPARVLSDDPALLQVLMPMRV